MIHYRSIRLQVEFTFVKLTHDSLSISIPKLIVLPGSGSKPSSTVLVHYKIIKTNALN